MGNAVWKNAPLHEKRAKNTAESRGFYRKGEPRTARLNVGGGMRVRGGEHHWLGHIGGWGTLAVRGALGGEGQKVSN